MDENEDQQPEEEEQEDKAARLKALGLLPNMAVMKTCCGCLNTKTGTMTILTIYSVFYVALIILFGIALSKDSIGSYAESELSGDNNCTTGANADAWWCKAVVNLKNGVDASLICGIVILVGFFVCSILAIYGTTTGKYWFMMPWIVVEFIFLMLIVIVLILFVVILSMYVTQNGNSSTTITCAVIFAAIIAFFFYLWLCVVSHFQILREVSKLGLLDLENVQPFENEDSTYESSPDYYPTKQQHPSLDYGYPNQHHPSSLGHDNTLKQDELTSLDHPPKHEEELSSLGHHSLKHEEEPTSLSPEQLHSLDNRSLKHDSLDPVKSPSHHHPNEVSDIEHLVEP